MRHRDCSKFATTLSVTPVSSVKDREYYTDFLNKYRKNVALSQITSIPLCERHNHNSTDVVSFFFLHDSVQHIFLSGSPR